MAQTRLYQLRGNGAFVRGKCTSSIFVQTYFGVILLLNIGWLKAFSSYGLRVALHFISLFTGKLIMYIWFFLPPEIVHLGYLSKKIWLVFIWVRSTFQFLPVFSSINEQFFVVYVIDIYFMVSVAYSWSFLWLFSLELFSSSLKFQAPNLWNL